MRPVELARLGRCLFARGLDARRCAELDCTLHNIGRSGQGPTSPERVRDQVELGEWCAAEVERIGPHEGHHLSQRAVGRVLGISKQGVGRAERGAIRKLRRMLGIDRPIDTRLLSRLAR